MTTAHPHPGSPRNHIRLLFAALLIETIRRKDLYVLLLLMILFVLGVFVVSLVGVENDSTSVFLLNLGLTYAGLAAHVLTILGTARQIPDEIENRTIYPLLARPLSRSTYYVGKWIGVAVIGMAVYVIFVLMVLVAYMGLRTSRQFSGALLAQGCLLQLLSIAAAGAMAQLGAIYLPKMLNVTSTLLVFLASGKLVSLARGDSEWARWLCAYVPDFSKLNAMNRFTEGVGALPAGDFAVLAMYGVLLTLLSLAVGRRAFCALAL